LLRALAQLDYRRFRNRCDAKIILLVAPKRRARRLDSWLVFAMNKRAFTNYHEQAIASPTIMWKIASVGGIVL
jgi:hypothetical protein